MPADPGDLSGAVIAAVIPPEIIVPADAVHTVVGVMGPNPGLAGLGIEEVVVNSPVPAINAATNGLNAEYYDNMDLTNLKVIQVDPTVDYNWDTGQPDNSVTYDHFTVRWTGQVEAQFSELYTFYVTSSDGVRLWVDNQLLIDNWTNHGPTENSGTIALTAGQRYAIRLDFYENLGGAVAKLEWSSTSTARQVIPQSQLYTTSNSGWVTGVSLGTPRNDATNWVGLRFTVGENDLIITDLGRYVLSGNSAAHTVKIVRASDGVDIVSSVVNTAGAPVGDFRFTAVSERVVLPAHTTYYLVSSETFGGDTFSENNCTLSTTSVASMSGAVYDSGSAWVVVANSNNSYGPVSLKYQVGAAASGLQNTSFETPVTGGFVYNPVGGSWTFEGLSGTQRNGGGWGAYNAPDGVQTAFLQNLGDIWQTVSLDAGTYVLEFMAARRWGQVNPIQVSVDGAPVGGAITPNFDAFTRCIVYFTIAAPGNHTIKLEGTNAGGDNSSFVDRVSIRPVSGIADSIVDFSDTQGQDNWYYGYFDKPGSAVFVQDGTWTGGAWQGPENTCLLWSTGGHPGISDWSVRRWVSEVTGTVRITGVLAKQDPNGGDGMVGRILLNDVEQWSKFIAYNDSIGVQFTKDLAVNAGDNLDFVISMNGEYTYDGTVFYVSIDQVPVSDPTISPNGGQFGAPVNVTLASATPGATIRYTTDGTTPTATNGNDYLAPFAVATSAQVKAVAFLGGSPDSAVSSAYFDIVASGSGTGLKGEYWSNQDKTFNGTPTVTRTDATVDFQWLGTPHDLIDSEFFSIRWYGQVQPEFSETYTFYTRTDDGVRLWVNGALVIDHWQNQSVTEYSGSLPLIGGQRYNIVMEYYEYNVTAEARLLWSSPSTPKAVVPEARLFPTYVPSNSPATVALDVPTDGQTILPGADITLQATASDPGGSVLKVEFFSGSTKLGEDLTAPFTFAWTAVPLGSYVITAKAIDSSGISTVSAPATLNVGTASTNGLRGEYFDEGDLTASRLVRIDSVVYFDWGGGSPHPLIGADTFSVRWTGQVQPAFSETYTFYTVTDDGVRLWVNGQLVIDQWHDMGMAEYSGLIALTGGQRYNIVMEYYENGGGAGAQLFWSSPSTPKAVIPQARLFPDFQPANILPTVAVIAPVDGSEIGADESATIVVNATDADGSVLRVEFYADGTKLGEVRTAPYEFTWSSIPAGIYSLTVRVMDSAGAWTVSSPVSLLVGQGVTNTSPTIAFTSPLDGGSINEPGTTLQVNATDADGYVARVEYFGDGTKIGESTVAPFSLVWSTATQGTYVLTARATDDDGQMTTSAPVNLTVNVGAMVGSGTILREWFGGIGGTHISDLTASADYPDKPNGSSFPNIFECPVNWADNYGTRMQGYVHPPVTGNYVFWIASDDDCQLWLSSDDQPANRTLIASFSGATGSREWTKYGSQQSTAIHLVAGQRYYVEALQKEGGGGDNLAVGWQLPSGKQELPIPGVRLSPFDPTDSVPPAIAITSPANGASFAEPANIAITVNVSIGGDSDTTNHQTGTITAQGENLPDEGMAKAFDNSTGTKWLDLGNASWIQYQYANGDAFILSSYTITSANDAPERDPKDWVLQGSNDGVNYDDIDTQTGQTFSARFETKSYPLTMVQGYQMYRLQINDVLTQTGIVQLSEIELIGHKVGLAATITRVDFYANGSKIGQSTVAPYNFTWSTVTAGSYSLTARAFDDAGGEATSAAVGITVDPVVVAGSGSILREWWTGIGGNAVSDLTGNANYPDNPTGRDYPVLFEAPTDFTDNYGTRMRGYVHPPISGNYVFWIASDDNSQLWLSTDDQPANVRQIAYVNGWTGSRAWTTFASQRSAGIPLVAGQRYYIEALQKDGSGGDNLAVAWQLPGGGFEGPIPGNRLTPYDWTIAPASVGPTVFLAATATPGTTLTGSTSLSVLGADDQGEATLTYTWSTTAKPAGAPDATFSANGTNAAKNCTASFTQWGGYTLTVTIRDADGLTVQSSANVNVILPPVAPSGLTGVSLAYNLVQLSWTDNSANETGFRIERKTGAAGTWAAVGSVGANVTSFQDNTTGPVTTYYYRVFAVNLSGSSPASNEAAVTTRPMPPVIIVQPVPVSLNVYECATFSVSVMGTPPFSYQWRKNGVNIPGANAISYTTPPVPGSDSGAIYSVVVTNAAGSTASNGAAVTVNTVGDGLIETRYANPDFTGASTVQTVPNVNTSGVPLGTSIRWTGFLVPVTGGTYHFYARTTGGVRLWLNDTLVMDRLNLQSDTTTIVPVVLSTGQRYRFTMEFANRVNSGLAQLEWGLPGWGPVPGGPPGDHVIIPQTQFFSTPTPGTNAEANGRPRATSPEQ